MPKTKIALRMDKLKIDKGIRPLIEQLWRHGYRTRFSCDGHREKEEVYVQFEESGDGWFEKNASKYGLRKLGNRACCRIYRGIKGFRSCEMCGAGVNRNVVYAGKRLIPNPFITKDNE